MNILLSAYACEPNKGSEPEVGWKWALALSKRGHQVYVITRKNNKNIIDEYLKKNSLDNLKFIYFDFPSWILKTIKGKSNAYAYFYIFLWQIGIFFAIKPVLKKIKFDFIHHVTFASLRFPSFLSLYNIPFIYGPVAGGDTIPFRLRKKFSFLEKMREFIRDINNRYIKISPFINLTLSRSHKIYVTSEETKKLIPKKYYHKTYLKLAIGIDGVKNLDEKYYKEDKSYTLCYVGNLLYLKGTSILISTFYELTKKNKNIRLLIAGDGPEISNINKMIHKLNISNFVTLLGKLERNKLDNLYKNCDLLLFPSLRDSGGFVILEAMSNGLPVAILKKGGPAQMVNNECGICIELNDKNEDQIIKELTNKISYFINNIEDQKYKRAKSLIKVKEFSWDQKVIDIYGE